MCCVSVCAVSQCQCLKYGAHQSKQYFFSKQSVVHEWKLPGHHGVCQYHPALGFNETARWVVCTVGPGLFHLLKLIETFLSSIKDCISLLQFLIWIRHVTYLCHVFIMHAGETFVVLSPQNLFLELACISTTVAYFYMENQFCQEKKQNTSTWIVRHDSKGPSTPIIAITISITRYEHPLGWRTTLCKQWCQVSTFCTLKLCQCFGK